MLESLRCIKMPSGKRTDPRTYNLSISLSISHSSGSGQRFRTDNLQPSVGVTYLTCYQSAVVSFCLLYGTRL